LYLLFDCIFDQLKHATSTTVRPWIDSSIYNTGYQENITIHFYLCKTALNNKFIVLKMKSFGFMIASCLRDDQHQKISHKMYREYKTLPPQQKIIVVVDFTSSEKLVENVAGMFQGEVCFENDKTIQVPADMLLYFLFQKKSLF